MSIFDRFSKKIFSAEKVLAAQQQQLLDQLHQQLTEELPASFAGQLEHRIQTMIGQCRPKQDSDEPLPVDGVLELSVCNDQMTAYVCVIPPLFQGAALTLDNAKKVLRDAQILYGVDDAALQQAVCSKTLCITPAAHGTPAVDGIDGCIEELFARKSLPPLELAPNAFLEFFDPFLMQPIQKGDVICRVKAPTPPQAGHNVWGRELPAAAAAAPVLPKGGANTRASGRQLLADADGILFWDGAEFAVQPWQSLPQGVLAPGVHLKFQGDFYLRGTLSGGASLETDGNLVIDGEILDATVRAGKNLLVRKGIHGDGKAVIQAGGQLQCPIIEKVSSLNVQGCLFADELLNSTVVSKQDVFVLGRRGLLAGGSVTANKQICAKQIGADGAQTALAVGVHEDLTAAVADLKEKLEQLSVMQERLRKKIITMRAASSVLSQERREEFTQMQEESKRLANQEKDLKQQLKTARETLAASLSGKVVCQTLQAPVKVRIGNCEETLVNSTTSCNIHAYLGSIVTR